MNSYPVLGSERLLLQEEGIWAIQDPCSASLCSSRWVPELVGNMIEMSELVLESTRDINHNMMIRLL